MTAPLVSSAATAEAPDPRLIEEAGFNYLHSRRQLFYDGWLVTLSPGKAKRARSVNPHFGSSLPLDAKIAYCEALYARHGLPALFRITPFAQPRDLDASLAARGYAAFGQTLVQVVSLDRAIGCAAAIEPVDGIELSSPIPEVFVQAVGTIRGSTPLQQAAHLERIAQSPLQLIPIVARREGVAVAAGMASVDGTLAGLFDILTAAAEQHRGIGTQVTGALMVKAWERGARHGFLQVDDTNAAALSVYRRFGFVTRYTYHYRARQGTTA